MKNFTAQELRAQEDEQLLDELTKSARWVDYTHTRFDYRICMGDRWVGVTKKTSHVALYQRYETFIQCDDMLVPLGYYKTMTDAVSVIAVMLIMKDAYTMKGWRKVE